MTNEAIKQFLKKYGVAFILVIAAVIYIKYWIESIVDEDQYIAECQVEELKLGKVIFSADGNKYIISKSHNWSWGEKEINLRKVE